MKYRMLDGTMVLKCPHCDVEQALKDAVVEAALQMEGSVQIVCQNPTAPAKFIGALEALRSFRALKADPEVAPRCEPPTRMHSLERTSAKGQPFVGTCTLCGTRGLTVKAMSEECENVRGLSQSEALVEAISKSAGESPGEPNYVAMDAPTMLSTVADDAHKWATAFMQITARYDHPIDHGDMIGWFANAIEYSSDVRRWRAEKTFRLPTNEAVNDFLRARPNHNLRTLIYAALEHFSVAKPSTSLDPAHTEGQPSTEAEVDDLGGRFTDIDAAKVGHSLMHTLDAHQYHPLIKDWSPAEDPAEIVGDLLDYIDQHGLPLPTPEAEVTKVEASDGAMYAWLKERSLEGNYYVQVLKDGIRQFSLPKAETPRLTDAEIRSLGLEFCTEYFATGDKFTIPENRLIDLVRSIESRARGES